MRDDIGFDRRPHHAERNGLGDGNNQQRALLVHDLGDGGNIFDHAEKIRRLHQHAGCLFGDALFERRQVEPPVVAEAERRGGQPLVLRVGCITSRYSGCTVLATRTPVRWVMRTAMDTDSAAPVEPSYMEALAISMPVSSQIMVWNSKMACSVPWVISAW